MSATDIHQQRERENRLKVVGQLTILEFADAGLLHELQAQALASLFEGVSLSPDELLSIIVDILKRVQSLQAQGGIWPRLLPGSPVSGNQLIHPDIAKVIEIVSDVRVHNETRMDELISWLSGQGWMDGISNKCGSFIKIVDDDGEESYVESYVFCEREQHPTPGMLHEATDCNTRYSW